MFYTPGNWILCLFIFKCWYILVLLQHTIQIEPNTLGWLVLFELLKDFWILNWNFVTNHLNVWKSSWFCVQLRFPFFYNRFIFRDFRLFQLVFNNWRNMPFFSYQFDRVGFHYGRKCRVECLRPMDNDIEQTNRGVYHKIMYTNRCLG